MSGNKQLRFADEFKREAVRLIAASGRSIQRVANDLGILKSTLSRGDLFLFVDAKGLGRKRGIFVLARMK